MGAEFQLLGAKVEKCWLIALSSEISAKAIWEPQDSKRDISNEEGEARTNHCPKYCFALIFSVLCFAARDFQFQIPFVYATQIYAKAITSEEV